MAHDGPRPRSIRLIPRLRAVHVERFFETTPATMIFFEDSYDLSGSETPAEFLNLTTASALKHLALSDADVLELPEPLWVRFLPTSAACAAAFKLGGLLRGRSPRTRLVVTYCMENSTIPRLIGRHWTPPRWVSSAFSTLVGLYLRLGVDRIAFASDGSRELYHSLPFGRSVESTTILELPTAASAPKATTPHSAVFVGTTDARKGVPQLLQAWGEVEKRLPDAVLTIIGPQAEGTADLGEWAAQNPSQRRYPGQLPRTQVLDAVSGSAVLVLPSVPHGRWREQIGLPIKEALGFGLTVVTTDQSGLAPWLAAQGHHVLDPSTLEENLASALVDAMSAPLPRDAVRASLPEVQGRYASDTWMHRA